jgi:hypothetical protein
MKKPSLGVIIFGLIEILTLVTIFMTLLHIEYLPMVLLFFPIPVAILGIFTIRLNPLARRLNLLLSPLIVLTYSCGFMIMFEYILSWAKLSAKLNVWHFSIFFVVALIVHIFFFTRSEVKKQFVTR